MPSGYLSGQRLTSEGEVVDFDPLIEATHVSSLLGQDSGGDEAAQDFRDRVAVRVNRLGETGLGSTRPCRGVSVQPPFSPQLNKDPFRES